MTWLAAVFIALVGIIVILQRRSLAHAQGLVLGGRIGAGCAIVEGAVLLLIAALIVVYFR